MKLYPKGKHITCFKPGDKLQRLSSVKSGGFIDNSYNIFEGRKSFIILKEIKEHTFIKRSINQDGIEDPQDTKLKIKKWGNDWIKIGKIEL